MPIFSSRQETALPAHSSEPCNIPPQDWLHTITKGDEGKAIEKKMKHIKEEIPMEIQ